MKNIKSIKNIKNKLTAVAAASIISIVSPMQSQAQMIVFDPGNFAQWLLDYALQLEQWYEQIMSGYRQDAQNVTMRAGNDLTQLQMQQDASLVQVDDARERRLVGDQLTVERDLKLMPTIEKCVELTRATNGFGSRSTQFSASGGSLNSIRSNPAPGPQLAAKVILAETAQRFENTRTAVGGARAMIEGKNNLGTCEGTNPINGCSGDGTHPGADKNVISWFGNVDTRQVQNGSVTVTGEGSKRSLAIANFSIDGLGIKIAAVNAANLAGITPTKLEHAAAQRAPIYQSMFETFENRFSSIGTAAMNVTGWRTAQEVDPVIQASWDGKYRGLYTQYFPGYAAPERPSQLDYIKTVTMDMYAKSSTDFESTDPATRAAINTSINNILLIRSMEKQDITNMLLATLVAQNLNPINKDIMEVEKAKYGTNRN